MLACAVVSLVFVLFLVAAVFVRPKSLAKLATTGKLVGMDESALLETFGVPFSRDPSSDPVTGEPRELLGFETKGGEPVLVYVDPATRTVTSAETRPV